MWQATCLELPNDVFMASLFEDREEGLRTRTGDKPSQKKYDKADLLTLSISLSHY